MGLGIMQERAESIGAVLEIASQPEKGTQIKVVWDDMEKI
jgi:nitrate/nitrite-specific signal transduction histidine kinase